MINNDLSKIGAEYLPVVGLIIFTSPGTWISSGVAFTNSKNVDGGFLFQGIKSIMFPPFRRKQSSASTSSNFSFVCSATAEWWSTTRFRNDSIFCSSNELGTSTTGILKKTYDNQNNSDTGKVHVQSYSRMWCFAAGIFFFFEKFQKQTTNSNGTTFQK